MSKQTATILGLALLLAAAAVRLAGINQQLWLDEIWSINWARQAGSFSGVFVLHHDNNHWLNTLYLRLIVMGLPWRWNHLFWDSTVFGAALFGWFLARRRSARERLAAALVLGAISTILVVVLTRYQDPGGPWWRYHLLSEATGIGTVLLGWLLARRRGAWEELAALLLLGTSEFLVEFSTDARGYAPAGFFALACAWLLDTHLNRPRRTTAAWLAACGFLGILSHLTFVVILAALIASSAIALARKCSWPAAIARTAMWWAVPIAMFVMLYFLDIRHLIVGGGPPTPDDLAGQGAAMILGIPVGARAAGVFGAIAVLLCAMRVRRMWREADPLWPLFLTALVFAPGVLLFWPHTDYVHPRYVYVAVPLLLTAMGIELGSWLRANMLMRLAAGAALVGFVAVNGYVMTGFLRGGRGDYLGALKFMADRTRGDVLTVSTDHLHPKPTFMVLQYYDSYGLAPSIRLATLVNDQWGQWPQWLVVEPDYGASIEIDGTTFVRRKVFPTCAATSGVNWFVYEAAGRAPNLRPENIQPIPTSR